ncbi:MAG TPA: protein kinase [Pirellulales bacterium]|nr:protein kinase [Pirellulales bacterium]
MKTCPACSAENNADSKFCSACRGVLVAGPEATVDHNPAKNDPDSSAHGRFLPGTRIAGRYRIVSLAGRGGMGEVYRADDLKLGHPVALKFLPRGVAESSRRFQLFVSEVRLSRQLAHPNVCRVYDIDEVEGQHFLSMEYIDGEDLKGLLRRIGRLPGDKGLEIAQQLCAGLAAAHEKGVLHRDLKPANVMIDGRGQARITDFGLARLEDSASGIGEIAGTPAYMAPEQLARGETTIQSDLYSLGLILYEAFTGQPAHQSGSIDQLHRAHAASSPRPPAELVADLDPAVERAILHSLQKDPRQRPASARAVADALVAREIPSPASSPPESTPQGKPSLAVLPFVNMNADHENEFLSDGITEDLIMALSRVKDLRVPARTSSFAFKGKNEDIRRIGQLLNVETVLEGSVRKSGNRQRVTAQHVKVRDGFHLWSERYDREMKDVFDIQDDISRAIVAALEVQLGGQADAKLVRPQTASMEAYELYVKGRGHWNQRGLGLKKGLYYFELALLEDPNYALAWSGLADAYFLLGFYDFLPIREAVAKAKTAAENAVALDDHSAEAHCSLGVVLFWCDWNWNGSEQHLLKALELNSNYTLARYWYGWHLTHTGRDQESIAQNRRAVDGDPLSRAAHTFLGFSFNSLKWFAEAVPPLRRALELDPNFAFSHQQLGRAYWFLGDREAALVELHRAVEVSGRLPLFLAALGQALALSGQVAQARQIQRELAERTIPAPTRPYWLYHLHAGLGENDLAFAALEQALIEREPFLAWCPIRRSHMELMSLESDPRWPVFIEKVKAAMQAGGRATI